MVDLVILYALCAMQIKKKIERAKITEQQNCIAKSSVKLLNCHKHCKILS